MAVGGPESDVFAAADAVLARGERPTVERVRLELGGGSPTCVGGLLVQSWVRLAERLSGETRLLTLPAEVSQAFVALWQQAIHLSHGVAEQALSEERQVLAAERERVAAVEGQARQVAALARQHATTAQAAQQVSETRLADLELLLEQRATQIQDLSSATTCCGNAVTRSSKARPCSRNCRSCDLRPSRNASRRRSTCAGSRIVRIVKSIVPEKRASHAPQVKEAGNQLEQLQQKIEGAQAALGQALQNAAAQQARGDTLEQKLVHLAHRRSANARHARGKSPNPSQRSKHPRLHLQHTAPTLQRLDMTRHRE
ncbi:DNA-binding protein [Pseudomonas sp. B15(2017)]|uniref:DNA-binding protein n=1 Tax=Pseudomonas sp. B15(2017) TaxID=1981744 RepID=UPI003531F030